MLVQVENVKTSFGKRLILNNVSLEIKEKSLTVITGKSGCGKTTLLGIISGLLEPEEGKVLFYGENIFRWSDFKRSRYRNKEIGFVFQFFNLLSDRTSYQNIVYPAALNLFSGDKKEEVDYLIKYLNLSEIIHHYPATLSGGERQRVAIARAIINHPKLILADEPTGNLDDKSAQDIMNLFLELKERYNMAIVVVTHDRRMVELADTHYHLEEGILKTMKSPAPLRRATDKKAPPKSGKKGESKAVKKAEAAGLKKSVKKVKA